MSDCCGAKWIVCRVVQPHTMMLVESEDRERAYRLVAYSSMCFSLVSYSIVIMWDCLT